MGGEIAKSNNKNIPNLWAPPHFRRTVRQWRRIASPGDLSVAELRHSCFGFALAVAALSVQSTVSAITVNKDITYQGIGRLMSLVLVN